MKLLLDTNVLVAAFVARGLCHELLEHCERHHQLVTSERLLQELRGVLGQKFRVPMEKVEESSSLFLDHFELVDPPPLPHPVYRDPDDDWVLAAAVAGNCDCVITGDEDLLDLKVFQGTPIIEPRAFWALDSTRPPP